MKVYVNESKLTAQENINKYGFAIIHTYGDVVGDDTYLFIETETAFINHVNRVASTPSLKCEIADIDDCKKKVIESYPFYTDSYQMIDDDGVICNSWNSLESKIKSEFNV